MSLSDLVCQEQQPKKKVRHVFGRREAIVEGKVMRFELRADGLHVWRYRSRKRRVLTFVDAVHAANGQGLLKL